ncbi:MULTISPECIES: PepSY domain-containing protein [unclassified Streptomyces]|uniref:PepSY domain-containing protein n=1 Tax=unclassified Streptomyces TaxID=2593676 RepID=UPI00234A3437|nr:PepSY domain-containing protein [Streptomyces sp. M92]WCN05577.1 PepSY domain-containing protein [Streptomyces sp. M92]
MSSVRRLPPLRSMAVICALGSSVLLMTGCTNADTTRSSVAEAAQTTPATDTASPTGTSTGTTSPSPSPSESMTDDQAERKALVPMAEVTWDKAADTAVKEVPDSKLVDLELKRTSAEATASTGSPSPSTPNPAPSQGAPEWEAKVATADGTVHRIDIDAVSGKVFRTQAEDQDADDKQQLADLLKKATQTPEQAVKAATDKAKGTVTHVELDENDDQKAVWSVDVVSTDNWNKTTLDVDATNGEILREHVDRD